MAIRDVTNNSGNDSLVCTHIFLSQAILKIFGPKTLEALKRADCLLFILSSSSSLLPSSLINSKIPSGIRCRVSSSFTALAVLSWDLIELEHSAKFIATSNTIVQYECICIEQLGLFHEEDQL